MSNLKKVLALALALAMVMTMFAGASIKTVLDVKDADEFTEAQLEAAGLLQPLGVLAGMGADELGAGTVTRAQMVAFIYRLTNGGDKGVDAYYSAKALFTDVDPDEWYAPYINWAYASKVAYGVSETEFAPEAKITGAQAAAMLVRLLGKDASGVDYALKAQSYAIALGLDDGIVTKGLYDGELARGDMFILLANALMTDVKGTTIAEEVFGLEIIHGAILIDTDTIGISKNTATLFKFRTARSDAATETAFVDVWFYSDILAVEDDIDVSEDLGCKYTLLVSDKDAFEYANGQGYRTLYAAYEEEENAYYDVVTGLVDDGALVFAGNKQNVFFSKNARFYVDEKEVTEAEWLASYGVKNWATYKLIDNDGDGKYEYAFIERFALADLGVETITAKVTAINRDASVLTLTTEDGVDYTVKFGEYWVNKDSEVYAPEAEIKEALGIEQPNYAPYTGISDVYYDFSVVTKDNAGYVFGIAISEKTAFAGNYGIFVGWASPLNYYKNMPYGLFMNENNEYFWAYVESIDELPTFVVDPFYNNALIYFTDADYSDDVVSFYTADFWNANQTYDWYEAFNWSFEFDAASKTKTWENATIGTIYGKEDVDYTTLCELGEIYAVMDTTDADTIEWWNAKKQQYVTYKGERYALEDRALNGKPLTHEAVAELEGKGYQYVLVDTANLFYGLEDLDECVGFVFFGDAEITVTIADKNGAYDGESFQIYKANGFWILRNYVEIDELDADDLVITWNGLELKQNDDKQWYAVLDDGTDPGDDYNTPEKLWMVEAIKGFDDVDFSEFVDTLIADYLESINGDDNDDSIFVRSTWTKLNINKGVVFAYGAVAGLDVDLPVIQGDFDLSWGVVPAGWRWVAYDVNTFNDANFAEEDDVFGIHDELIFTIVGGTTYVKAMKVTSLDMTGLPVLPNGWMAAAGYELVVFNGLTGAVNTNGWEYEVLTLDAEKGVVVTSIVSKDYFAANVGELLLIQKDAEGNVIDVIGVGGNVAYYIDYLGEKLEILSTGFGTLVSAKVFEGEDLNGDPYEVNFDNGKATVYVYEVEGEFVATNTYNAKAMNGLEGVAIVTTNYNFVLLGVEL